MKKILASILAAISVLSLTACGENPVTPNPASPSAPQTSDPNSVVTFEKKNFAPIEITGDNVLNSVRVFDTMYEDNKQAMFSPLSLNMCLGMVETGAAGDTKKALDAYLGNTDYAKFAEEYLEHAKSFTHEENNEYSKYKNVFEIANSFWASDSRPFNEDYKKRVAESFAAELETLDFTKSEKAADKINGWVNKKTHEMIPAIVGPSQLGKDTAAVLVNTIYFESAWSDKWYVPKEKEKFTNADGSTVDIELMRNGGNSYFENDNATAFSCRYKNGMKFIGILPKNEGDFTLESLDINSLLESESWDYDVSARMPKLNFESSFPLTEALKAAGLEVAFSPSADFSPMRTDGEPMWIDEVIQKTKLELDDEGTKAAAATAIIMKDEAAMIDPRETKEVFLNRPFAFLIYDDEAEQIVFMGKVTALD
ncbi:MAG: serpin family protein [Oscillospiraceae bacterium]|nr:serpin family protein [Oscillospiraceae bacterium]